MLENWIKLYEATTFSYSVLMILNDYYLKTEELKIALINLYEKYDYLEWVQHKLTLVLSSNDFSYTSNELSNFYRRYIDKITTYSKLSFYLMFTVHIIKNENDSLLKTMLIQLNEDEKNESFYFKDWIIWHLKFAFNYSVSDLFEISKRIEYN